MHILHLRKFFHFITVLKFPMSTEEQLCLFLLNI